MGGLGVLKDPRREGVKMPQRPWRSHRVGGCQLRTQAAPDQKTPTPTENSFSAFFTKSE